MDKSLEHLIKHVEKAIKDAYDNKSNLTENI